MPYSNSAYQASDHMCGYCNLCSLATVPGYVGSSQSRPKHFKAHGCTPCARWCMNIEQLLPWPAAAVLPTLLAPNATLARVTVCPGSLLANCWQQGCLFTALQTVLCSCVLLFQVCLVVLALPTWSGSRSLLLQPVP